MSQEEISQRPDSWLALRIAWSPDNDRLLVGWTSSWQGLLNDHIFCTLLKPKPHVKSMKMDFRVPEGVVHWVSFFIVLFVDLPMNQTRSGGAHL